MKKISIVGTILIILTIGLSGCTDVISNNYGFILNTEFPDTNNEFLYYKIVNSTNLEIGNPDFYSLPDNFSEEDAVIMANEYVEENELGEEGMYIKGVDTFYMHKSHEGQIIETKREAIRVAYGRKINDLSVVGPGDFIDVCISVQKYNLTEVVYCTKNWRHLEEIDNISIIGAEEAYDKLLKGEMINEPMTWFTFEINEISVGYYSYFNSHPQEYYKPVWIFYGKLDGSDWYFAVEATK